MEFNEIDKKWQEKWEKKKIFKSDASKKKKFYCLEMFPYPSGSGLHMGHALNYTIGDVLARFKRMKGFNVLYPMGYDSLGLPAENAAIKEGRHPKEFTEKAINNFIFQQKKLGLSYDWDRLIKTHDSEYYKWNQYFFLKFLEEGLVYRKKAPVNYCPECNTVLANEQVHNGKCWRHSETNVEIKQLEQWFIKTTKYAEELLNDIEGLDWPEKIKIMQKNWIGRSEGTLVKFKIKDDGEMPIFTTRVDTLWGVTFMVYAPEHPKVIELVKGSKYEEDVKKFIDKVVLEDRYLRNAEDKEKEGMFIGRYAINPVNNEEIPIYIANFVLPEYGGGAVMAVPAHDQRDFEFAKKYGIPIKVVIKPEFELDVSKMNRAYVGDGMLINSDEKFNGMNNRDAIKEINNYLEEEKIGKKKIEYKLKDWLVSRQRYWGTPIPVIYCEKCGIVPVLEKDLPIELPEDVKFGSGNPLATNEEFLHVKCPKCGGDAKRETDTMDTFFDSSWYYLRYCDSKNDKEAFDKEKIKYWMPVDQYIGGAEHACMHLIYARFFTKALRDLGLLKINEPFLKLFNQGMLHGKDGYVMSKSRGNVVLPEEFSKKYGIDTARVFLVSVGSPDKDIVWSDKGAEGSYRFLNKVFSLREKVKSSSNRKDKHVESKANRLVKEVEKNIEEFNYNIAIVNIMEFVNYLYKFKEEVSKKVFNESFEKLLLVLSVFAPHICEELYEKGGFISEAKWPKFYKNKINYELEYEDEFLSDTIKDVNAVLKLAKIEKPKKIILSVAEDWKYKLYKDVRSVNSRDLKQVLTELNIKDSEKIKIVVNLLKKGIPDFVLDQKNELKILEEEKRTLEGEFKIEFEITKDNEKAFPGKVAIKIE